MASHSAAVSNGRKPSFGILLWMAALMAAFLVGRSLTRTDPADVGRGPNEDPQKRGAAYEDHVLGGGRLQREASRNGGKLRHHPFLYVPLQEIPAHYYMMPKGYRGGTVRDPTPHESALTQWSSVGPGGYRIPDAMETRPDGSEVLYELKCPSPWLTFDQGSAWAAGMQTAFASQALAYFIWAKAGPKRSIVYGFCGWVPPLRAVGATPHRGDASFARAEAILTDLENHFDLSIMTQETFLAVGFKPAGNLVGKQAREMLAAAALRELADLAPDEVAGAAYDRLKD